MGDDLALRATFDQRASCRKPLDSGPHGFRQSAPFVALAPETANDFTYSLERRGKTQSV